MLRLSLLLLEEIDDEGLVLHYEVVRKAFGPQVIAKVVPPVGIECFQHGELRRRPFARPVDAIRRGSVGH